MKPLNNNHLVAQCNNDFHEMACAYVARRVNDAQAAEDIVQDAYLRMLEYGDLLLVGSLKSFFFTTVKNIMTDYLRRHRKRQDINAFLMEDSRNAYVKTEEAIVAKDLRQWEISIASQMPKQRRTIYNMSRFDDATVAEISEKMQLNVRTVENHLRMGRQFVRNEIRRII